MKHLFPIPLVLALLGAGPAFGQDHVHPPPGEKLGTVHFETSCAAAAQPAFDRAVSLLHSFEFGVAIASFDAALKADPTCGMTQWGVALSRWGNPFTVGARSAAQIKNGLAAVERARAIGATTERERAYIDAVANLYADGERRPQRARVEAYRDAMGQLARRFPDDTEAPIFYALSLTAAEDINDKTYASRLQAVAILEPMFAKQPNHPGLAHYIIHSYDVPALAPRALGAAKAYADIAPSAPHALHMPSHTFTRVGLWQQSIEANIASAAVAKAQKVTGEELHASDYQMYAYLQTAQDGAAKRLLEALPEITARFDAGAVAGAAPPAAAFYAMAAIPARWALERGAWADAAKLEAALEPPAVRRCADRVRSRASAPHARARWRRRAPRWRGSRRFALAKRKRTSRTGRSRSTSSARAAAAWVAFAEGRKTEALAELRAAADAEDKTEKAAVTPGPLAPAREQLGDMLLLAKDARGALKEFQATLVKEPNRFRALYGAARAAAAAGSATEARRYYKDLTDMCARADAARPELRRHVRRSRRTDAAVR